MSCIHYPIENVIPFIEAYHDAVVAVERAGALTGDLIRQECDARDALKKAIEDEIDRAFERGYNP